MTRYDLKDVKLPVLSGKPLRITTRLIEFKATGDLLGPKLIKDAGIHLLREICLDEAPTNFPKHPVAQVPEHGETELSEIPQSMPPQTGFCPHTSADFCNTYSIGEITPLDVARRIITAIDNPIRQSAASSRRATGPFRSLEVTEASTARWQAGKPLGPLDGVPVSVKAELDQIGQYNRWHIFSG